MFVVANGDQGIKSSKYKILRIMDELVNKISFNCIITGPSNCGKTRFLIKLSGTFRKKFEFIVLICPTYTINKTYENFAKDDKNFLVRMSDASNQDEINEALDCCKTLFSGFNTLIILDDCAVSQDLKKRSNKFIDLAFSGRHSKISVWVLTQQLTSIAKPFRDNVACVVAFHNPSKFGTKTLFEDYGADMDAETIRKFCEVLKSEKFSRLCLSLRYPFETYLEIPNSCLE